MDEASLARYILETFDDAHQVAAEGVSFFFRGPDRKFPFATIVTRDNDFDRASNLDRPGVFRLNIGIEKATFLQLFGAPALRGADPSESPSPFDLAALDTLMPHPAYGAMYWACVLNPVSSAEQACSLLVEAYAKAAPRSAP